MKTVKIKVAVAVDHSGSWNACGGTNLGDKDAMEFAAEVLGSGEVRYWLTAELPVPENAEIAATVTLAPESKEQST